MTAVLRRVDARLRATRDIYTTRVYDDPRGEATGYGWYGLATRLDSRAHLALGRPVR